MSRKRSREFYNAPDSPTTTESSSCYSVSLNPLPLVINTRLYKKESPLTLENVAKIQDADASGMPLARYCYSPVYYHTPSTKRKRNMTRPSRDNVLESPRILPFPYHNDSFFLPTAEHDYPGRGSLITDTCSTVSHHTYETQVSRPSNSYQSQYRRWYSPQQKRSRASAPVTPVHEGVVSQKTKHHRLVYKIKNFNFNFKIDTLTKTFGNKYKEINEKKKVSWYEKIKKFFKKDTSASGPVCYNQFNPILSS